MILSRFDMKVFDQKMTGNIVKLMISEFGAEKIITPIVMQVGLKRDRNSKKIQSHK